MERDEICKLKGKFSEVIPICDFQFNSIQLISPEEETWELWLPLLPRNMQNG